MSSENSSKKKQSDRNAVILKAVDKELVHLDNMAERVNHLSDRYVHQSYVERILLRIEYTRREFKEFKNRVMYDKTVEEIHEESMHGSKAR